MEDIERGILGSDGNVLYFDVLVVTNCMHLAIHTTVYIQKVIFFACKLYRRKSDLKQKSMNLPGKF